MDEVAICSICGKHFYPEIGCEECRQNVAARLSRIEARFERLLVAEYGGLSAADGGWTVAESWSFTNEWEMAERAESFLESKRAEVK